MKDLVFTDTCEVAELAYTKACELEDIGAIYVVGFYDEITEVLKEVLQYEDVSVGNLELHQFEWSGYDREFLLTVDENLVVGIEPAYYQEKEIYLGYEAETLIIHNDCNSAIIMKNFCENAEVYCYEYENECDEPCECCRCGDKHCIAEYTLNFEPVFEARNFDVEEFFNKLRKDLDRIMSDL